MKIKTKILVVALAVILAAIAVIGGSLAWFSDTDEVTNVFTVGEIKITIHDENKPATPGTCGSDFTQSQFLLPIVNTEDPTSDANYINKIVHVSNDGKNAAYVRAYIAVPYELSQILVLNLNETDWVVEECTDAACIGGVKYQVYQYRYCSEVGEGTMTYDLLTGVYMKSTVDIKDNDGEQQLCTKGGDGEYTFYDFDIDSLRQLNIPVAVQAVQSSGFSDAETALDSTFPEMPWSAYISPASPEEVTAALEEAQPGDIVELPALSDPEDSYGTVTLPEKLEGVTLKAAKGAEVTNVKIPDNAELKDVVIDGFQMDINADSKVAIEFGTGSKAENLTITNLKVEGNGEKTGYYPISFRGLDNTAENSITVKNCEFHNTGYGMWTASFGANSTLTVDGCKFDTLKSWAILLNVGTETKGLTVTNCTFNKCNGVKALNTVDSFIFENNTMTDILDTAFSVKYKTTASVTGSTKDGTALDLTAGVAGITKYVAP